MDKIFLKNLTLSLIIGALIGVIASYGDTLYNDGQFDLILLITGYFNTATLWSGAAFLIGFMTKSYKKTAVLGLMLLISAVTSYYLYGYLFGNRSEIFISTLVKTALIWIAVAVIVGPFYAISGSIYKYSQDQRKKIISAILLSLVILSENIFYILQTTGYGNSFVTVNPILIVFVFIGLILPFILLKNLKHAVFSILISCSITFFAIGILEIIFTAIRSIHY